MVKLDQKYVVYNALLPETDDSLLKNQRTTFVVLVQGGTHVATTRAYFAGFKGMDFIDFTLTPKEWSVLKDGKSKISPILISIQEKLWENSR